MHERVSYMLSEQMESKRLAMLLVVLLRLGGRLCEGCLEEERVALFQLEPFFSFIDCGINDLGYDSVGEKEISSNCCEWERVECNLITGRVTSLFLNNLYTEDLVSLESRWDDLVYTEPNSDIHYDSWRNNRKFWYLNTSLFLPSKELQMLSLSGNFIAGCVHNEGSFTSNFITNYNVSTVFFNEHFNYLFFLI